MVTLKKANSKPAFQRRILIYGASGAGKSHLVGTLADVSEMKEVLVLPLDGGEATLSGKDLILAENTRKLKDAEEVLWNVVKRDGDYAKIKTVVLDGISEAAKRELQEIADAAAKNNSKRDRDENQLRDYQLRNGRLLRLIRMARDIPGITLIMTAWPKITYPKVGEMVDTTLPPLSITPDFSDKLTDTVLGAADDVWALRVDNDGRRLLYTGDYQAIRAKTRNSAFAAQLGTTKDGQFFPVLVNPDFQTIVDAYYRAFAVKQ